MKLWMKDGKLLATNGKLHGGDDADDCCCRNILEGVLEGGFDTTMEVVGTSDWLTLEGGFDTTMEVVGTSDWLTLEGGFDTSIEIDGLIIIP